MGSCVSHYSGQVRKEGALSEKERAASTPEKVRQPLREETAKPATAVKTSANLGVPEEVPGQSDTDSTPATCSPTYTNLGQFRASMTPLKQPRNPKHSEDVSAPIDPAMSDSDVPSAAPPLLPKKTVTGSVPKDRHPEKQPSLEAKGGGANLSVANPVYNMYSTWDSNSQSSFLSTASQPPVYQAAREAPGLGSIGRPANSLSCLVLATAGVVEVDKRGTRSTECLLGSGRQADRPRVQPLHRGVDGREEMGARIRRLHRDMLRKLAGRCEERFGRSQAERPLFSVDDWADFRLTASRPLCEAGDAHYYSASYAKDPHGVYAIKVCKSRGKESHRLFLSSLGLRQDMPAHFNIQQDCGHFLADLPRRLTPGDEVDGRSKTGPGWAGQAGGSLCSCVVIVTREVPFQTAAEFVREGVTRHAQNPELYERQVCLLLLQLCQGLEHMKQHHVTHCNLRLENLLLVPCRPAQDSPPGGGSAPAPTLSPGLACPARLLISNFTRAKLRSQLEDLEAARDRSRVAPEIAIGNQYSKCDEFQTGILIYEMLHLPNPFEDAPELKEKEYTPAELPPLPGCSLYSEGLGLLARSLLRANPSDRLEVAQARACLQCLLWGPRDDLFQALAAEPNSADREAILQNWLDLKQTLMMIKFAERSLDTGAGGVSLEDWLCCQYLAFSSTESLSHIIALFQDRHMQNRHL